MNKKFNPVFDQDYCLINAEGRFFKTLKIAVSERVSEICQKNKRIQTHFSLFANLKIKPYEFPQKPE
jgi:hypothetical protein